MISIVFVAVINIACEPSYIMKNFCSTEICYNNNENNKNSVYRLSPAGLGFPVQCRTIPD